MKRLLLIMLFLALGSFANGEVYKEYYPNGALFSETRVINGKIRTEIEYKNNRKNGVAKSYDENGKLTGKIVYKDDVAMSIERY